MSAFVPFTTVTQRFAPAAFAQACSNSATTLLRDQTPLRTTSSNRFSSVSGFQTGHSIQGLLRTAVPPRMAGLVVCDPEAFISDGANVTPAPKTAVLPIKSRRDNSFFFIILALLMNTFIGLQTALQHSRPSDTASW